MNKIMYTGLFVMVLLQMAHCQNNKTTVSSFPEKVGIVNDFEGIYNDTQKKELSALIMEYQKTSSNEIIVVTIKSYKPCKSINEYATKLMDYWQIGTYGQNNGVILIVGRKLRKVDIVVEEGLTQKLNAESIDDIITKTIIPEFRKRELHKGIELGVREIINILIEK